MSSVASGGIVAVTGAAGLVGSEAVRHFTELGCEVIGVDNDLRRYFFGPDGSTVANLERLQHDVPSYRHHAIDIRDRAALDGVLRQLGGAITLVVHAAAQPSHDWAAREPMTDFDVNAVGTLNVLESVRNHCPEAVVAFISTNKVYGDTPNQLPFVELATRWSVDPAHPWSDGIPEDMSIDKSLHSFLGASKLAADILVQEYGRYFDIPTVCLRAGTITGAAHAAAELHGFLAYLVRCALEGRNYVIHGYLGKQVRDVIHARDLVRAIEAVWRHPAPAQVYNVGGGPSSNCSVLEAIDLVQEITGRELAWSYSDTARRGDHIWWISSLERFETDHRDWHLEYSLRGIVEEMAAAHA